MPYFILHKSGGDNLQFYFIPILVMFILIFIVLRKNKLVILKNLIKRRQTEDKTQMIELAKRFIDKECLVYSFDGHQFEGIIKEVSEGALLIERNSSMEAINLDFVTRIREYPRNKKGKKKSLVLD